MFTTPSQHLLSAKQVLQRKTAVSFACIWSYGQEGPILWGPTVPWYIRIPPKGADIFQWESETSGWWSHPMKLSPTLPSFAWLRAPDRSSSKASRSPTPRPRPSSRKRPRRSWGRRASEVLALLPAAQLLDHHFCRRCVSSPDSLSFRMAMVRFLSSGEPDGGKTGWLTSQYQTMIEWWIKEHLVLMSLNTLLWANTVLYTSSRRCHWIHFLL